MEEPDRKRQKSCHDDAKVTNENPSSEKHATNTTKEEKNIVSIDSDDDLPELINLSDPSSKDVKRCETKPSPPPKHLTVLSWNIDGLDDRALQTRAYGVFEYIHRHTPDVVLLQEVVAGNLEVLEQLCSTRYHISTHKVRLHIREHLPEDCNAL